MSIAPTCVEDINFSAKTRTLHFTDRGKVPYIPNMVYAGEYNYLTSIAPAGTPHYEELAYPYYRKLYVYHDRFGTHMPVRIRKVLLQAIADSL